MTFSDERLGIFLHRCHAMTYAQHGGSPYLTPAFFQRISVPPDASTALLLAWRNAKGVPIASSLLMARCHRKLYGRYWGAIEHVSCLHFEACYYRADRICDYEQGAAALRGRLYKGEHKLARGLDPTPTQSAPLDCRCRHFRVAIATFLAA